MDSNIVLVSREISRHGFDHLITNYYAGNAFRREVNSAGVASITKWHGNRYIGKCCHMRRSQGNGTQTAICRLHVQLL
jgi:hypothetical protein